MRKGQSGSEGKRHSKRKGECVTLGQHENLKPSLDAAKTLTEGPGQTGTVTPTDHKYSEGELALVHEYGRRLEIKPPKITRRNESSAEDGDSLLFYPRLMEALGTVDRELGARLLKQVTHTADASDMVKSVNCALAALHGIHPRETLEGLLAVQMVGVHNLAMTFMARAVVNGQTIDLVNHNVNRATRLLRTFVAQMEMLNRLRGKGEQRMVVKHVHVYEGGQAIVGTVTQNKLPEGGEEGGDFGKTGQ